MGNVPLRRLRIGGFLLVMSAMATGAPLAGIAQAVVVPRFVQTRYLLVTSGSAVSVPVFRPAAP